MAEEHNWGGIAYPGLTDAQKNILERIVAVNKGDYLLKVCAGFGKTIIAAHAVTMIKEKKVIKRILNLLDASLK